MADSPRIIGVSGFLRTGKDSVAALLQQFGYERTSFADPLRKMAADIDPYISLADVPNESFDVVTDMVEALGMITMARYTDLLRIVGYERAKAIPDFRRYLQRLGTEGVRGNFGQDAWVNKFIANVEQAGSDAKFVVPDVRFPNEADTIKELGGVVWRTERPGFEPVPDEDGTIHPSEAMVLEITPDVTLRADNLFDLGSLVLKEIGREDSIGLLSDWADAILSS